MTEHRPAVTPARYPPIRLHLAVTPLAQRRARETLRRALQDWDLEALTGDGELLVSELVTNAIQHGDGNAIELTIGHRQGPDGETGILCQVTDTASALPRARAAGPDSERGRGLHVVSALAADSGVTKNAHGKTAWFTLNATRELQADHEAEAGV